MNKKTKFLSSSLCALVLAFSTSLTSVHAASITSKNITNKNVIHSVLKQPFTGTLSGYATQSIPLLASPNASCKTITSWLMANTRFVITRTDTNGWYYGAWGSDYNGWHFGWVQVQYIDNITLS
ncbi:MULTISPECIES: hypothetical protein [Clostridium]|uniref:hypothetical protein n=1 Tax=Clostridium TaxID=1485 RepID=UPI000825EAEA|nr:MULTISPECIES: hypothetical protein [Clostridium]PJI10027.1 hypothetical protein CUB90_20085 [Clostridium sp. CT7]